MEILFKKLIMIWNQVPILTNIKKNLENILQENSLQGEGNYYYNNKTCGIGYHGDSERRKVIAIRIGASLPIYYQWFYKGNPVGNRIEKMINGGDIYMMSAKAVGNDWKIRNKYTLRHAVGCDAFTKLKKN